MASYVDGVNLKLAKTGGIREAVRMIHAARALGLRVMLGCMVESSLGISAAPSSPRSATSSTSTGICSSRTTRSRGSRSRAGASCSRAPGARRGAAGVSERVAVFAEAFADANGKTAHGMIRYGEREVVGRRLAPRRARGRRGRPVCRQAVPIVASVAEAADLGAQCLAIGVAPAGGRLPPEWKAALLEALALGLDVEAGLHDELGGDPELVAAAAARGLELRTCARVPAGLSTPSGAGLRPGAVVHTVGTDCAIGKMTVALELAAAARAAGERAVFVPTGQTGIAIAGWGIAVDHVVADYVAGAAERLVLEGAARGDLLLVEGQGAILHPAYSGVTLGLLHGCTPHALVLVHEAGAERIDSRTGGPARPVIPPLAELSDLLLRLPRRCARRPSSPSRCRRGRSPATTRRARRSRGSSAKPASSAMIPCASAPSGCGRQSRRSRMTDPRLARYARLICEHSLAIDASHRLLIRRQRGRATGHRDGARGLAQRRALSVIMTPEWAEGDLLRSGSDAQVAYLDPAALETVEEFDRWLFVWAPGNTAERAGVVIERDAALARAREP